MPCILGPRNLSLWNIPVVNQIETIRTIYVLYTLHCHRPDSPCPAASGRYMKLRPDDFELNPLRSYVHEICAIIYLLTTRLVPTFSLSDFSLLELEKCEIYWCEELTVLLTVPESSRRSSSSYLYSNQFLHTVHSIRYWCMPRWNYPPSR